MRSGGGLDLEAVEERLAPLGQDQGDPQLLGDREAEVLQRAQGLGEGRASAPSTASGSTGLARCAARTPHLQPALQALEVADVLRHLLGRRRLAIEAAAALRRT